MLHTGQKIRKKTTEKEREGGKKHRGVTDQKQNASKCRGRGKIANTREELRTDEHPRCRPHYQRDVTQSLQIRCFAICQPASMRDTVQYDIIRDELCYFETTRKSLAIIIS